MPRLASQVSGLRTRIFSKPSDSMRLAVSTEMISFSFTTTSSVMMSTMVSRATRPLIASARLTLITSPS